MWVALSIIAIDSNSGKPRPLGVDTSLFSESAAAGSAGRPGAARREDRYRGAEADNTMIVVAARQFIRSGARRSRRKRHLSEIA